ncbi:MAG TPA: phosphatase PAP2 family protein [Polyangia bacterium]|jgi:undecaprenyl-diphosphatase|nr:phosphatase PAP2 family protein [Polyangia bacterium]
MNVIDRTVFDAFGQIAGSSPRFDAFIRIWVSEEIGFKSDLAMAAVWWTWFRPGNNARSQRSAVLSAIVGTAVAVFLGRILSHAFPFRMRPFADPSLHLTLPSGSSRFGLRLWSSFPSDHALVWAAIATGMGAVSTGVGILLWTVGAILVCAPRVYVGLHFPTDILAGFAIGALVGWGITRPRICEVLSQPFLLWESRRPSWFYAAAFLLTLHVADMFSVVRMLGYTLLHG